MRRDPYRSVGALVGLGLGIWLMFLLTDGGMIAGAVFGAGGAVLGGMSGERLHAWRNRSSE